MCLFAIYSPSPSARSVGNSVSPVSTRADDVGQEGDNTFATLYMPLYVFSYNCSLAPDCSRLLSSPNKQSGKYNEMDPILIGTAISEHVIREMSKPTVPLVKAL